MANIKLPRKEFEEQIKLTPEIIEKITLLGTPLESINKDFIEIEVFPNRPDLLSFHNYMRTLKTYIGKEKGIKEYKINPPQKNYNVKIDSELKNIRPYTACAIVKKISFTNEKIKDIITLQEKLHTTIGRNRKKVAIGIYPLEKISLPIRYKALLPEEIKFTPLEGKKEMSAKQILKTHPTGKTYKHLLEKFNKYPIFIDSKSNILSMPPIINSHETGKVTLRTKEVFIECSGWHLPILEKTLNIIVATFAEMGGEIYKMNLEYEKSKKTTPNFDSEKKEISIEKVNKILGLDLKEQDIEKLLTKMEYNYKNKKAYIAPWRIDILHEVDIIEDIAIAYGYDKLIPKIPKISTTAKESNRSKIKRKISELLLGLNIIEISTYHLIKQEEAKLSKEKPISLLDSKTEYKLLRPNLLIPALRILSENKDSDYPQRIFEIGKIFYNKDSKINEKENLLIALTPSNLTEIKQTLDYLTTSLEIEYDLNETEKKMLIEGRTAQIKINNKTIGHIGEIHPKTLKAWNIKQPVSIIEISIEDFLNRIN